jgi:hypothetical protein
MPTARFPTLAAPGSIRGTCRPPGGAYLAASARWPPLTVFRYGGTEDYVMLKPSAPVGRAYYFELTSRSDRLVYYVPFRILKGLVRRRVISKEVLRSS